MATQVPFTEEERKQLAEANAIRQRIKSQRRKRQETHDYYARLAEQRKRELEARQAEARLKAKEDFDHRIRSVLVELTRLMSLHGVHIVSDAAPDPGNRVKTFAMSDSRGLQPTAAIYWVYGKGFEWA